MARRVEIKSVRRDRHRHCDGANDLREPHGRVQRSAYPELTVPLRHVSSWLCGWTRYRRATKLRSKY